MMFTSLRSRILLTYILVIITVLCIVAGGLVVYLVTNPLADRQDLASLERWIAVLQERPALVEPFIERPQLLVQRLDRLSSARVLLLDADLSILADSRQAEQASLDRFSLRSLRSNRGVIRDADGDRWLFVRRQINDRVSVVFALPSRSPARVLFSQQFREIFRDDILPPLLRAGLAALFLALLLAVWLSRWIASPLQRMAGIARRYSEERYQTIPISGPEEVQSLAAALNEMTEKVQMSQQSQRDFIANVSHELKTPLTSIQGYSQAILDGTAQSDLEVRQASEVIYNESARMHRLVMQLLDLARFDSGIARMNTAPLDLNKLLRSVVKRLDPQASQAQVAIQLDLEPVSQIYGDEDRLGQVLANLLDNAIKFTPAGESIIVRTRQMDDSVEVLVRDRGAGIASEEIDRVFDRFYQTDKSRSGGSEHGVGLGLTVAREIVNAHGGHIQAFNSSQFEPGAKGSVFVVKLPMTV